MSPLLAAPTALVAIALAPPQDAWDFDLPLELRRDLKEVGRWIDRYEDEGGPYLERSSRWLAWTIERLGEWARNDAVDGAEGAAVRALLDLTGASPGNGSETVQGLFRLRPAASARRVHDWAGRELRGLYDERPELVDWLASQVLATSEHPLRRRIGAARSLAGLEHPGTLLALFGAASADVPELRDAAMDTLLAWRDERVDAFLARQLSRWVDDPSWIEPDAVAGALAARVPAGPAAEGLARTFERGLADEDWRTAARTLRLAPPFDDAVLVPALIDALERWLERAAEGLGRRRLAGDLASELERRARRRIGPHPDRWRLWWTAVLAGRAETASDDWDPPTRAGFFGLRPETDRVAFVIDRSGSMARAFAPGAGRSRFEEAASQLLALVRALGPEARFGIVLFDDRVRAWRTELVRATDGNLDRARRFLASNRPDGGTRLFPAVREVLRLDADGRPALDELDIDTVIVLCDGQTEEGPSWVDPLVDSVRDETAVRFHGVQIGAAGDGTLQRLAQRTGGEFVRVAE